MQFPYQTIEGLEDATANFERIQYAFALPVYSAAPPNPAQGQMYFDTTLVQAGVWTGAAWHYF